MAPHFCLRNFGFLAVSFHIYACPADASTDFALFLIVLMWKLRQNGFGPVLRSISYAFGPHSIFGLAILSGHIDEWFARLQNDGLVGSYGGVLEIPFVTWPIDDDDIQADIPLTIDLARWVY